MDVVDVNVAEDTFKLVALVSIHCNGLASFVKHSALKLDNGFKIDDL